MIVSVCWTCGSEYEPSHAEIVSGDWRWCPACRERQLAAGLATVAASAGGDREPADTREDAE